MPQQRLKILGATTKPWQSQINKYYLKKEMWHRNLFFFLI